MTYRTDIPCGDGGTVCEVPDAKIDDTVTYSKMFDKPIEVIILELLMHKSLQTDEMMTIIFIYSQLIPWKMPIAHQRKNYVFPRKVSPNI